MLLYQILPSTTHGKKRTYKSSKFKMSAQTWNGKFELPDGLDYVSDIQDYFEYNHQKT